ncbi:MAG: hypothetical protein KAJ19_28685 [Gammaproteobacteria bacterium]|nr:hypothetical protein [Gammaproteobacteria bacterium]
MSKKRIIEALHATKGAVYLAAKHLDCSHMTVYRYINKYPDIKEIKDYYDEEVNDIAELGLRKRIIAGDLHAIKYQLSTKGKGRGYVERQEVQNDGELTIKIDRGE